MSDLLDKIRSAQITAREDAAINGGNIHMAGVMAGEQVVIDNLRRQEAEAKKKLSSHLTIVGGTDV